MSWCHDCCCSDWSQPVEDVGACVGTTGAVYGCATGNIPLAVFSGVVATTNAVASGRMACLGDTIRLGHSADQLNATVVDLKAINISQAHEVEQLQTSAAKLHSDIETLQKQNDESRRQREEASKRIEDLTQKLTDVQNRYVAAQEASQKIQQALTNSQKEQATATATASADLHADEEHLSESLPLLTQAVKDLKNTNQTLKSQLADMKQQESVLQSQIEQLTVEKTALERLIKAEESEAEVQERIQKATEQLHQIEEQWKKLAEEIESHSGTSS